ncbi:nudix hydrolase 20 [Guyanagaster necrorhizus]|uniref:Nudix hydrolase 20 n=1 Tax=Guyanagaster necrorhizus TaxID=856835 RepID=A0A9P8AXP3_9AGAR|nr:nudix hydrolase 20 [Guyanagaster necrorhizus MCA 3950]KAG7451580.1 nudix hydrolase 20 [Guyanagaster necrorhizus MCA 3950]
MTSKNLSFLDLIDICDNVRPHLSFPHPSPFDSERLVPFHLSPSSRAPVIGLLRPIIIEKLKAENVNSHNSGLPELWDIQDARVSFRSWLDTPSKRTAAMKELCERWRDTELFPDVCGPKKWRAEMFPIYRNPFDAHDYPKDGQPDEGLNYAFEMERSACALFGVVTYGIHMTIYQQDASGLRMWIPTRARTKPTWPGYLDNTVAGGIPSGMGMFDSLAKECMEEASIEEDIVRQYVRATGAVSYFFRTSAGWLQPEVEYVYDLAIPANHPDSSVFEPKPLDGEVESFEFLHLDDLTPKLRAGSFKPNCALGKLCTKYLQLIIDLLIRLGHITPENEPDYMKILTRLHGQFDYERW